MHLDANRTAFMFPGQGSQSVGMGRSLAQAEPAAAAVFERADDLLGYPLSELCWEGPERQLNDTLHAQPALLTHSVAVLRVLQERLPDFQPSRLAGHSLGEYSALVAAGSLDFDEALLLVRERGRAMKQAGERFPGGMAAVLGMDLVEVEQGCRAASEAGQGSVWVANDNCPGQIVISGDESALTRAIPTLNEAGAKRVVRLAVSIASHSPLMQPALETFNLALDDSPIKEPIKPVIGNVRAIPLKSAVEVREDLREQLVSRIRWTETIQAMLKDGVNTFFELGAGTVLLGLLRRIERSAVGIPLEEPESFHRLVDRV
jgi:[acyl-carrier-protein] S-malonyltransferase